MMFVQGNDSGGNNRVELQYFAQFLTVNNACQ